MNGNIFKKVKPGQKLRIPAATYNAFIDAAKKTQLDLRVNRRPSNSGGASVVRAEVIECPTWGNALAAEGTKERTGITYYTLRATSDSTTVWNEEAEYLIGQEAIGSNNLKYVSKTGTLDPDEPNVGNDPVADTEEVNWEQSEEIRVEYVKEYCDADGVCLITDFSIRDCSPLLPPGSIVPYKAEIVDAETRYYIDKTFQYQGTPQNATLRNNTGDYSEQVVFQ